MEMTRRWKSPLPHELYYSEQEDEDGSETEPDFNASF